MHLSKIIQAMSGVIEHEGADPEITRVVSNSRRVREGFLFVAIPGTAADGWDYVDDAITRGAAAIVTEHASRQVAGVPQVTVSDARAAYAESAAVLNGHPARHLRVVGITGTNGKTTTAYMIRGALRGAGLETGLISTVAYEVGQRSIAAGRTTPDAATTQDLLRQMVDVGCSAAVMEVSSHALIQKRTVGVDFDVAVFTNLTRDHLDYHKTMDAYYEAKAILFRTLADTATALINLDDAYGQRLQSESLACNVLTYSMDNASADVRADDVHVSIAGCHFVAKTPWGDHAVKLKLLGRHNVSNALACIGACGILGTSTEAVVEALSQLETVRGRLEPVVGEQRFSVFVDYAHTDDALAHALRTVRELTTGRVIVVFGCGGNRDKTKRPVMGQVAAELADVVVVTSDNPRNEAPEVIIEEILSGVTETSATIKSVEDRAEAIRLAIGMAEAGDVVLIAGKGHETHQECGSRSLSFDDHEVAQEALQAMQSGACKSNGGND